ncbi:MAG: nucleotidyltransferase domain-containing protein [Muribaculaceae bacterium]|nr:nucleotidyltransferase domain-containing protein [Muribaculaceae bacterium]
MVLIHNNIAKIIELCRKYKVSKLYVFGSILTERFNDESDIDFSVDFDKDSIESAKLDWADLFFGFLHSLEDLLQRKIDLVFDSNIRNTYFKDELDRTKQLIYG